MGLLCLEVRSPEETRISQLCRTKCLIFCAYSPPLTSVHFKNIIFKGFVVTLQASINSNNFSALLGPQIFVHSDGAYIYSFTIFFFFFNDRLSLSLKTASGRGPNVVAITDQQIVWQDSEDSLPPENAWQPCFTADIIQWNLCRTNPMLWLKSQNFLPIFSILFQLHLCSEETSGCIARTEEGNKTERFS